jgi:hypothetical protein
MIAKEVPNMDGHADLKLDAASVRAAMAAASGQDVVKTFVKFAILADLNDEEIEALRNEAAKRSGTSKRAIARMLQEARQEQAAERQYKAQERALAKRSDPRPKIEVPGKDAPWLPVMAILDEVISYPILRDSKDHMLFARKIRLPGIHAFANAGPEETGAAPELWTIERMNEMQLAELIEQYVEFVDKNGRSVHLPAKFVRHYLKR